MNEACWSLWHEAASGPEYLTEARNSPERPVSRFDVRAHGRTGSATDQELWEFAIQNGFAVVTKDEDFNNQSVLQGSPPKVIWLQLGNCTTDEIEAVFRRRFADIEAFDRDPAVGTLILS